MGQFLEDYPNIGPAAQDGFDLKVSNIQGDHKAEFFSRDSVSLLNSTAVPVIRKGDDLEAAEGFDSALIVRAFFRYTAASFSNTAVVNLEDANGNSTGLAIDTLDGSEASTSGMVHTKTGGDGSTAFSATTVDLSADSLVAKTTTLASDNTGTAGAGILYVEAVPKPI